MNYGISYENCTIKYKVTASINSIGNAITSGHEGWFIDFHYKVNY